MLAFSLSEMKIVFLISKTGNPNLENSLFSFSRPLSNSLMLPKSSIDETKKEAEGIKEFYEQTLNDLPGQIAVFDPNLKYLYVNPESIRDEKLRKWIIGKNDYEYCEGR